MEAKEITILGLGWIGLNLADAYHTKGWSVMGTVTSPEKKAELAKPYSIVCASLPNPIPEELSRQPDILVVAFPPGLRKGNTAEGYHDQLSVISSYFRPDQLLFLNSTSIYKECVGWVGEETFLERENMFLRAEEILARSTECFCSLRLGGLMGEDRIPAKYFKAEVPNANYPVNYIHQADVLNLIDFCIDRKLSGVYNACSPEHPTKKEVILDSGKKSGIRRKLRFADGDLTQSKIVDTQKLLRAGYSFIYPNPLSFSYQKV